MDEAERKWRLAKAEFDISGITSASLPETSGRSRVKSIPSRIKPPTSGYNQHGLSRLAFRSVGELAHPPDETAGVEIKWPDSSGLAER